MLNSHAQYFGKVSNRTFIFIKIFTLFIFFVNPLLGQDTGYIAAASSHDGRLEFVFGKKGVWHTWQTPDGWAPWDKLDTNIPLSDAGLVTARDSTGRLMIGWLQKGGVIRYSVSNMPGGSLTEYKEILGTHDLRSLTIATNADGRLELFALDSKGRVWSIPQKNAGDWEWGGTHFLEGHDLQKISVTPFRDGRLALMALGKDQQVYWKSQTGPNNDWGHWQGLQGKNLQDIIANQNADGRLEVDALGKDGNLYQRFETAPDVWSGWQYLATGPFQPPINLARSKDGTLEIIAHQYNELMHSWQAQPNGSFFPKFERLSNYFYPGLQGIEVFTLRTDNKLIAVHTDGSGSIFYSIQGTTVGQWSPWSSIYLPGVTPPPPPPNLTINEFKTKPNYVDQGNPSTISWSFSKTIQCGSTNVVLTKKIYGNPEVTLLQQSNAASSGSKQVTAVADSSPIHYYLRATCEGTGESFLKETSLSFSPNPPPPASYIIINGPFTDPFRLIEKKSFTVTYWIENQGNKTQDSFDVELLIDNIKESTSKTVPKLESGHAASIQWTVTKELVGFAHSLDLVRGGANLSHAQISIDPQ